MKHCKYYETYSGPKLIKVTVDDIDILSDIIPLYGESNNWNETLYTVQDIINITKQDIIGKTLRLEYHRNNGHIDWTEVSLKNEYDIWNGPLFQPICESFSTKIASYHINEVIKHRMSSIKNHTTNPRDLCLKTFENFI
tara:strand:+ start:125 stop:541 length:417 start_codon:yes stop_codon:yes gene_type:complete